MRHHRDRPHGQRRGTPSPPREDGVGTLEVALMSVLFVVIILMGVPIRDTGITGAVDNVTNAMLNPETQ